VHNRFSILWITPLRDRPADSLPKRIGIIVPFRSTIGTAAGAFYEEYTRGYNIHWKSSTQKKKSWKKSKPVGGLSPDWRLNRSRLGSYHY
jgi:hypothetical protein